MTVQFRSVDQALKKAAALARKGDRPGAEMLYAAVLQRYPDNRRAADGLEALSRNPGGGRKGPPLDRAKAEAAVSLLWQGRYAEALRQAQALAEHHRGVALLHTIAGACLAAMGRPREALEAHRRALVLAPGQASHHNNIGDALNRLGRHDEAIASLNEALEMQPDYPEALNNLGNALNGLDRPAEAITPLEAALASKPGYPEALNNLGIALAALGRRKEAVARYEQALENRPGYAEAWRNLSVSKRFRDGEPQIAAMQQAHAAARSESDRLHLGFALGKALDETGQAEGAFACFSEANAIARKAAPDIMARQEALFARIRAVFEQAPPRPLDAPPACPRPVFVLGMPRSGTSLVEQILASHPQVYGAGELQALRRAVAPALEAGRIDERILGAVRTTYLESLAGLQAARPVIVDKMPLNFRWIGFAAAALPEAVFIHTRRDPVAVGWSLFRTFFPARGLEFTCSLQDIAAYTRLHDDLMVFWQTHLPGRIHVLDYERLTRNQEEETRRLVALAGLPWDDACLRFHETERVVRTASAAQVRQPLYQGSSEAWRRYEKWLSPLIEGLA